MEYELKLGEMLLSSKRITEAQLKTALATQKGIGGRLGTIIIKLGYLSEDQLAAFLAEELKVPLLRLKDLVVQTHVSQLLDLEVLEKRHVLPIRRSGDSLLVATVDPMDLDGLDEIHFLTGLRVEPAVASRASILKAIDYYFHGQPCPEIHEAEKAAGVSTGSHAAVKGERASPQAVLQALTELLIEKKVITQEELLKRVAARKG